MTDYASARLFTDLLLNLSIPYVPTDKQPPPLVRTESNRGKRDRLLNGYRDLRDIGETDKAMMAERLGYASLKTFETLMYRARRQGDRRAADWPPPPRTMSAAAYRLGYGSGRSREWGSR